MFSEDTHTKVIIFSFIYGNNTLLVALIQISKYQQNLDRWEYMREDFVRLQ